eukprot:TRINITY_DN13038_c1_g1_i1.p1 TRINITY_DN13038_c1_g1~~TRINITY_DN13038_c1_g1_i1.p1  ORF type:complete len:513 (+),score=76.48 TRINITY_DN13038_c1_g1_i1:44-1582(+)
MTSPGSATAVYDVPVSYSGPSWEHDTVDEAMLSVSSAGGVPAFDDKNMSHEGEGKCIVMVGLPGRGKTFLAHKICRYLNWIGLDARCFLVSQYLRDFFSDPVIGEKKFLAPYYSPDNKSSLSERLQALEMALKDVKDFLLNVDCCDHATGGSPTTPCGSRIGRIAIIDGQATQTAIRQQIHSSVSSVIGSSNIIYLEVSADSDTVRQLFTLKHTMAENTEFHEYAGMSVEKALEDFESRVKVFEKTFEPLASRHQIHMNTSNNVIQIKGVSGFLQSRMLSWIVNLSPLRRLKFPIFFARHGQSEYNVEQRIGGNPGLTAIGKEDASLICNYVRSSGLKKEDLIIWTSTLRRTVETVEPLRLEGYTVVKWKALNEIHAGICEELTYAEVEKKHPYISEWRRQSKYTFRYPGGESYQDLVQRLEPVLMEMESSKRPVLVVAHQAVLRTLFAYFDDKAAEFSAHLTIPQATVWRYHPTSVGLSKLDKIQLRTSTPPHIAEVQERDATFKDLPATS